MKNVYYSQASHETTFHQVLDLLFYYCLNNTVNQLSMKEHVPYLIHMATKMDIKAGHLLGQIISAERLNPYGQKFT